MPDATDHPNPTQATRQTPVEYAERVLEVHKVHEAATSAMTALKDAQRALVDAGVALRVHQESLADQEAQFAIDLRAANPEMSATAFEKFVKEQGRVDDELTRLRQELIGDHQAKEQMELRVREHEFAIRIACARMEELGGYLNFLAVVKAAATRTVTPGQ